MFNNEQIFSALRSILLAGGAFAVGKGWVDNATMLAITGALVTLLTAGWAVWLNRKTGLIAAAATVNKDVTIVAPHDVATATPGIPNIVSNEANKVVLR